MLKNRYKKASSRINRRSEIKRIFGLLLKIGLPVALIVGLVLLLRANFLQIKNFEVVGVETMSEQSIKSVASNFATGTRFFLIPKSNIFLLNKNNLANILLSDFSRIEKIEVNKKFFSEQVEIKIIERKADFLWCSQNSQCFFMTLGGLIFEKTENTEGRLIFKGGLAGDPLMQSFATPTQIQNYLKLVAGFKSAGFTVSSINIESNDKAVAKIQINNNVSDIIFDPNGTDLDLVAQNVLLLIKETKTKNPSAVFNYIDARFGNKMYYKLI